MNTSTPIWQLTVGEFMELMRRCHADVQPPKETVSPHKHERLIHGIDGLAEYLGISKTKAMSLRKSGAIDQAATQLGRRLVFDPEKLMKLLEGKRV